jgi:hypothetical protein
MKLSDTQGQDLVEYALAAGLVAVVAVIFTKITSTFSSIP